MKVVLGNKDISTSIPCHRLWAQSWYLCQMLGNMSGAIWEAPQAQKTEIHPQVPLLWDQSQRLCQVLVSQTSFGHISTNSSVILTVSTAMESP